MLHYYKNNLGELEDVKYFQKKLYRSLNIPVSRLETEGGFNLGRSTEITRDEIKFTKFIQRLRKKFSELFQDLLRTQLVLKGIITHEDWDKIREFIVYDFQDDNHFHDMKQLEILGSRLESLQAVNEYVGVYYSVEYVRRYILHQSDTEIEEIDKQIEDEKKKGVMDADAGTPPGEPPGGGLAALQPMGGNGPLQPGTTPGGTEFDSSKDQEYSGSDY